jgi:uncharacterized circularly permuted ATP-grasp superfamily protein/uncharacterized alpha-E superfamily protein
MTKEAPAVLETESSFMQLYPVQVQSGYDEAVESSGHFRAHWQMLGAQLSNLTPQELEKRAAALDRRVRETGIAYDIFSHPNQPTQRWQLDLAPVVFSSAEWQWMERALIQRARLFDAVLSDLYGAQNLMRRGVLPPELIFSDPSFLRPCQGILPSAGPLRFYAADLARDEHGQWRVIDNHTETLAGIGFAIANRVVHTHITGDIFKRCNGVRLAQFFQNLQVALTEHAGRDNARVALLTPGPHHEDYFSHAYLARYLGYLLVEGSDLRTKGSQVYLKTLEGLKEIDLIVRCVDGRLVDGLELDPAGTAGPAGLLRVNRSNPRLIVNAAGSALVQNRGVGPYLADLAKDSLGEDLELPDAPRCWLGDEAARKKVLANLDHYLVRQAQEGTGRPGQAALGQDPRALSERERDLLVREIHLHGATLVAEEKRGFSTAPAYHGGTFESRPFAVRCFVARTAHGYEVMPGGLAMTVDANCAVALSTPDGHTRDVWVLSEKEQRPHVSLWRPMLETARVVRSQRVIQSRVADDLFWLGRYNERADWTMRVLRGTLRRIEEDNGPAGGLRSARKCLDALLNPQSAGKQGKRDPDERDIERLCTALISSPKCSRALQRTFENLYRCANLVRDRLSFETWQTLSKFRPQDTFTKGLAQAAPTAVIDFIDEGLASIAAFNGLMQENMTRNFGWSFLDMGRRIERAYNLAEAVRTLFIPDADPEEEMNGLRLILELADSFITYRSRYRLDPSLPLVLDLLLLDETNPRSLAYQLAAIAEHLEGLPDGARGAGLSEDRRLSLSALTAVRLADMEAIAQEESRLGLDELLSAELEILPELSNAIGRHYFNLTDDAPHRVHTRSEPRP